MKDITIIMPFLNEEKEPQNTIDSIYQTANPKRFEIIAIDDCSKKTSEIRGRREVRFIRNRQRIGVDACRQLGADLATTPCIFIIDAHMRFPRGWLGKVIEDIQREPQTLWCTTCMGLGYGNMDLNRSRDKYRGADFVLLNRAQEILEPKWRNVHDKDTYEIPCVLGANYGVSREWFQHIHGLKGLKIWGCSEMFMSLKTWMAGGSCKINTNVKIGHKFRDTSPYAINLWHIAYNKMFLCKTLFPKELSECLIDQLPKNINTKRAAREIQNDAKFIAEERAYYQNIFKRDIKSVCEQWKVSIPC